MKKQRKPYQDTDCSVLKTQEALDQLFKKYKIGDIQFTVMASTGEMFLRFPIPVPTGKAMIRVRLAFSPNDEKEKRRRARMLYWWLKSKLEAVDSELEELIEAFLAWVELSPTETIGQVAIPQIPGLVGKPFMLAISAPKIELERKMR